MVDQIRTIIVDSYPIVIAGVRALIDGSDDIVCVGAAGNGRDALPLIEDRRPDVTILEVTLPDINGLVLAQKLLAQDDNPQVVVLTLQEKGNYVEEALRIGALGFVQKRSAEENLLQAIRAANLGGLFLDECSANAVNLSSVSNEITDATTGKPIALTGREEQVLRMVAHGYSNKEIAWRVSISLKSIETYKARATTKLGLYSRAQIVDFAIRQGWMHTVQ